MTFNEYEELNSAECMYVMPNANNLESFYAFIPPADIFQMTHT